MTGTQPFPEGARVRRGPCAGAFCAGAGDRSTKPVVTARVGETWRLAREVGGLCADCLADFAVMGSSELPSIHVVMAGPEGAEVVDVPRLKVWAESEDGLFHEVQGRVP